MTMQPCHLNANIVIGHTSLKGPLQIIVKLTTFIRFHITSTMPKDPQEIKDLAGKYSETGGRGSKALVVTFSQEEDASYNLSGNSFCQLSDLPWIYNLLL